MPAVTARRATLAAALALAPAASGAQPTPGAGPVPNGVASPDEWPSYNRTLIGDHPGANLFWWSPDPRAYRPGSRRCAPRRSGGRTA